MSDNLLVFLFLCLIAGVIIMVMIGSLVEQWINAKYQKPTGSKPETEEKGEFSNG